jgi:hypothetical protein
MKKLLVLVLTMVMASSALAVVDSDANMIGLYFDTTADSPCVTANPYQAVPMYAILTNPSFDLLYGFEFGYTYEGNIFITAKTYVYPEGQFVDVGGSFTNFLCGYTVPYATTEATMLVTLNVVYADVTMAPVTFHMTHANPSSDVTPEDGILPMVLLAGGELMNVGYSTEGGLVAAQINGTCAPVATESMSFDSVKSLYR